MEQFEVIIIGGSYAGLSAALALGRSLRSVLIIDNGRPCNRQTPHSHNFLTQDGEKPAAIAAMAKAEVLKYSTVQFVAGLAVAAEKTEKGFLLTVENGAQFEAKKLIFATGIKDLMPDIPGFSACWGISVVHCPYCHGYELRNLKTGIMANGARAIHLISLVKNLTKNITLFTMGKADFTAEELSKLNKQQITIEERPIIEVLQTSGQLNAIVLEGGNSLNIEAMYAGLAFSQHCVIPESLGCEITAQGYISVDNLYQTSIKGIYACGDNAGMMRSVANSVYSGKLCRCNGE